MPHCPRFIYHNILSYNLSTEELTNMYIIGNSFANYEENVRMFIQPQQTLVEELYSTQAVIDTPLDFLKNDVFDHTSLMTVDPSKLPESNDKFWLPRELMQPKTEE